MTWIQKLEDLPALGQPVADDDLYYTVTDAGNFSRKVTAAELKSYLNLTNGVPSVVGQNGKYLTNDGINYFWQDANIPVDHSDLTNHGANTHDQIDTAITNSVAHIADTTIHMPSFAIGDYEKALSVDAGGFKWKEFVDLVTSQIVGGLKFFNLLPQQTVYSAPTIDEELTPKKYVDDQLDAKLPDQTGQTNKFLQTDGTSLTGNLRWTEALDLTTSQQVGPLAVKTFVEHPQQLVYIAPTSNTQYTPKQYVDGLIASSIASISGVLPSVTGHFGEFLTNDGINSYWTNLSVLGVLPPQGGHAGEYLTTNGTTASWVAVSGEANTASNLGTGTGIFKQKTGVDLELYSIKGGTNVSVGLVGNEIVIDSTDTGEANTASNVGTGEGVFKQKTGVDLEFKTIKAGSNVTVSTVGNDIVIDSTSSSTLANVGSGSQVYKGLNAGVHEIRSITTPDTEIILTQNTNDIEIKNEHVINTNNIRVGSSYLGLKNLPSLTTGGLNIAIGYGRSGRLISSGSSNIILGTNSLINTDTESNNIAVGNTCLWTTSGERNVSVGNSSLTAAATLSDNVATGYNAAAFSAISESVSIGSYSMYGNAGLPASSSYNVAIGFKSLYSNTTGSNNVSIGHSAGYNNTTGSNNIIVGYGAASNASASNSVIIGYNSALIASGVGSCVWIGDGVGGSATGGSACTYIGSNSGTLGGSFTNATAIGYTAVVDASNHVRVGNTNVTQIGGQVAWSNLSDIRIKKNIEDIDKGLDFVKSLRPVKYNISNNDTDIKEHWGLIAQELQEKIGDSKGVLDVPENPDNMMSIAYTELVAPLIKAIQEQQEQIESLKQEIQSIKNATN